MVKGFEKYYELVENEKEYEKNLGCEEGEIERLRKEIESNNYGKVNFIIAKDEYYEKLCEDGLEELLLIDDSENWEGGREYIGIYCGGRVYEVNIEEVENCLNK